MEILNIISDWWFNRCFFDSERRLLITGREAEENKRTIVRCVSEFPFKWKTQVFLPGVTYGLPDGWRS